MLSPRASHRLSRLRSHSSCWPLIRKLTSSGHATPRFSSLSMRQEAADSALEPPAPREWAERLGVAPERFRDLLAHLERSGALVRAPPTPLAELIASAEAIATVNGYGVPARTILL